MTRKMDRERGDEEKKSKKKSFFFHLNNIWYRGRYI